MKNTINLSTLNGKDLISLYSQIITELRNRNIIRTGNVTGELGEYLAIEFYNKSANLPNLQVAPVGTENIDAISRKGERYSIKTITQNTTGAFYGLLPPETKDIDEKKFEYVIIVQLSKEYELLRIIQLSWDMFLKHKRWHSRILQWNLTITQDLLADATIVFEK